MFKVLLQDGTVYSKHRVLSRAIACAKSINGVVEFQDVPVTIDGDDTASVGVVKYIEGTQAVVAACSRFLKIYDTEKVIAEQSAATTDTGKRVHTDEQWGCDVEYVDTREARDVVFDAVLEWFLTHHVYDSETITAVPALQPSAIALLRNIAKSILRFKGLGKSTDG